jgi:hypothetical protein
MNSEYSRIKADLTTSLIVVASPLVRLVLQLQVLSAGFHLCFRSSLWVSSRKFTSFLATDCNAQQSGLTFANTLTSQYGQKETVVHDPTLLKLSQFLVQVLVGFIWERIVLNDLS